MSLIADPPGSVERTFRANLGPDTRLQLAPGMRSRFDAAGHVIVSSPEGTILDVGPRGYAILSLFSAPLALSDAIDRLEADLTATDVLPTLGVINALIEEEVLVDADGAWDSTTGWADPVEHARMLDDTRRTTDYLAALAEAVRPGDVVLEIGTGSGVLSVAAARAGARRVYAVEATDIARVAERVFAANGVEKTVTLIPGWSRQIELPEPADLLVTEIIGSEALEEEILETTLDARRRLLKPEARMIPSSLTLLARPLLIPEVEARQHVIGREAVERWRGLYGIELQALRDAAATGPVYVPADADVVSRWPAVGPPVVLAEVNLATFEELSLRASADLAVDGRGELNAVAVTFRAHLHGGIEHTLDPWRWPASSWATSVWVLPDPQQIAPRSLLRVDYSRGIAGTPDGLSFEVVGRSTTTRRS